MQIQELNFARPAELQAEEPAEERGLERDEVKLLVSSSAGHHHAQFIDLSEFLREGDLLVVNRSATIPASLPALGAIGPFRMNLSTAYGNGIWLAEPRWSSAHPGPLPLNRGERIAVAGLGATLIAPHPGIERLWFVSIEGNLCGALAEKGEPIRYSYVEKRYPLGAYQTLFSSVPGSAEMPSAARPFTRRVVNDLRRKGVNLAGLLLHTGVSSLEIENEDIEEHTLYAEPFRVPAATARAVNRTRQGGGRVIAVGTTVVRALESAWSHGEIRPANGFTRAYIHPGTGVQSVDGLITGLHDPKASHLAMLFAVADRALVMDGYHEAVQRGYLWHEFGDSHLILNRE